MKIHCCLLDKDCQEQGMPPRLYIKAFGWQFALALTPDSRFGQRFDRKLGCWDTLPTGKFWTALFK